MGVGEDPVMVSPATVWDPSGVGRGGMGGGLANGTVTPLGEPGRLGGSVFAEGRRDRLETSATLGGYFLSLFGSK